MLHLSPSHYAGGALKRLQPAQGRERSPLQRPGALANVKPDPKNASQCG